MSAHVKFSKSDSASKSYISLYLVKRWVDRVKIGQRDDPPPEPEPARLRLLRARIPRVGDTYGDRGTRVLLKIGLGVEEIYKSVLYKSMGDVGSNQAARTTRPPW